MADSDEHFIYYESFGEGSECELCGWNPDSLTIEKMEEGSWYITRAFGCYGGWGEEFDTLDEAIERLERFKSEEFPGKKGKRVRRHIKNVIISMREHETNGR